MKKNSLFQKAKKLQENGVNILDIEKLEIRGNLECGKGVFIETNVIIEGNVYLGDYVTLYYYILISHIILAVFIIPLALITLYRGWNMQVHKHRRIARITYPIWLYVSITGVVIYLMLY